MLLESQVIYLLKWKNNPTQFFPTVILFPMCSFITHTENFTSDPLVTEWKKNFPHINEQFSVTPPGHPTI